MSGSVLDYLRHVEECSARLQSDCEKLSGEEEGGVKGTSQMP